MDIPTVLTQLLLGVGVCFRRFADCMWLGMGVPPEQMNCKKKCLASR